MSNITLAWDNEAQRGDWQVSGGGLATGNLLASAVLISLFSDRVAQPDYVANDGSTDRRGWWMDTLDGTPIGSRLWQLRRRKIANRPQLIREAGAICREALQWLVDSGIAQDVTVAVASVPAGVKGAGSLLSFEITVVQPGGAAPLIRTLWSAV